MKQLIFGIVLGLASAALIWSYAHGEAHGQSRAVTSAERAIPTAQANGGVAGGGCGCTGDITNATDTGSDGVVDGFDLLALLGNWGPCAPVSPNCCENDCACPENEACCGGECTALIGQYGCGTGACAANYQCVNDQVTCTPGPSQPEQCNGLDDNCNGIVDDGAACGPGESCCFAQCISTDSDPNNCGGCGLVCNFGDTCTNGSCQTAECTTAVQCDDGNPCTFDTCVNFQCVNTPQPGLACDDGNGCTVSDTCDSGGSCVGLPVQCGPNSFCSGGTCFCLPGFGDCNSNPADGCEVSLNTSLNNCGSCGNVCVTPPNASATCVGGACGLVCNPGFADCNSSIADGCEVNLTSSVTNCGACGNVCPNRPNATRICVGSTCGFVCNPGFADCNGAAADGCEVNTNSNNSHCGGCGLQCPIGMVCVGGSCMAP